MAYKDTQQALGVAIAARVPVILWGAPGQGKTSVINDLARGTGCHLETILASIREPSDFAGLPVIIGDQACLVAPNWAKRIADVSASGGQSIVFFDEITTAPPSSQAALLRVSLDRVVGDLYLGDRVSVVAAANPPEIAANGWDLAAPMANRFVHLDWNLPAEVVRQGFTTGWPVTPVPQADPADVARMTVLTRLLVASFIGARPDYVTVLPKASSESGRAWPSPRSWDNLAALLGFAKAAHVSSEAERLLVLGCIGDAAGGEFLAYADAHDLPDPEEVLADPDSLVVPTRADRVYALGASVMAAVRMDRTDDRWRRVGNVIAQIAMQGQADVAVALASEWLKSDFRQGTNPDMNAIRTLTPILKQAGVLPSRDSGK